MQYHIGPNFLLPNFCKEMDPISVKCYSIVIGEHNLEHDFNFFFLYMWKKQNTQEKGIVSFSIRYENEKIIIISNSY